uniref:Uncharacterized protein n=1 Tax=Moschus moschiferus TaxID=68415 RepID=A0A8C6DUE3_MOSMO
MKGKCVGLGQVLLTTVFLPHFSILPASLFDFSCLALRLNLQNTGVGCHCLLHLMMLAEFKYSRNRSLPAIPPAS